MAYLNDALFDAALTELDTATTIHICSALPATYTAATSTNTLGNKSFGAGGCFGAIANGATSGRKVSSTAITDGTVTGTGTATHYAVVDGTRLLAAGALSASQAVTSGNTFTLASFDVTFPDAA
jgi:hypothetical protein